ncbi:host-nuclease inhibitor Gam family protein [Heyndrickxia faecalis]|uniref:host-nuclease inhibitor Gam family protein n=1 Tax=Heyndrickxia faecalis TaxID=2824910 RepID=UPI003100E05C
MNPLQSEELMECGLEERQRFEITNLESLTWAFRKLSALKAKEAEIEAIAKAEKQRIDEWETAEKKTITANKEFFEGLINAYHVKVLKEDKNAKTLSTPYGKAKARKVKEQPEKANEKAVLKHVVENGMDAYIKSSLKWADFKKSLRIVEADGKKVAVDENGVIVDGVEIKPEQIKFSVEVD